MTSLIIKQSQPDQGRDTKTFRAYRNQPRATDRKNALGISASSTGNVECGAKYCAAKAFIQFTEPYADINEIRERITLTSLSHGVWLAMLQEKGQKL